MTPKEQLREKFKSVAMAALDNEEIKFIPHGGPNGAITVPESVFDNLMAAVEEVMGNPLHITIKPSDEQLEEIRREFQSSAFQIWAYGDPVPHVPSYGDNT